MIRVDNSAKLSTISLSLNIGYPIKYPQKCFFLPKPSHGGFGQFFPTGTYTGIGTSVSSLKHVMKSTTKKRHLCQKSHVLKKIIHKSACRAKAEGLNNNISLL